MTKLAPHVLPEGADVSSFIHREFRAARLRLTGKEIGNPVWPEPIFAFLAHTSSYAYREDVVTALLELKRANWSAKVGISCYEPEEALAAAEAGCDCVEVPFNVLDRRFAELIPKLRAGGVFVLARAPFLQGMLAAPPNKWRGSEPGSYFSPALEVAAAAVAKVHDVARNLACPMHAVALRYAIERSGADAVVFGAETLEQVKQDCRIFQGPPLGAEAVALIEREIPQADAIVVNPSLWAKG